MKPSKLFCFKYTRRYYFFLAAGIKISQRANATAIRVTDANNPSDDWLNTGWAGDSQTRTRLVDSVLYHVFVSKQCILCSALRHKGYLTLPYVTLIRDSFYWAGASQPRVLSRRGCSLAIMFKEDSQILKVVFKMSIRIQFVTTTGHTFPTKNCCSFF